MRVISSVLFFFLCVLNLNAQQPPAAALGMRIELATETSGKIEVVTTGAKFELGSQGAIQCQQRIPRERRVLEISFTPAVGPFHIQKQDGFSCTVSCRAGTLTFQGDSVVILNTNQNTKAIFKGFFNPAYHAEKEGKWILMDAEGGFGIYPVANKQASAPVFTKAPWDIAYEFAGGDEVWLSVFPPRPFNWRRA